MEENSLHNELELSLQEEMELSLEREKLDETINLINKEILRYIEQRTHIEGNILDYRKKVLEEYKDDEDKIVEYFDHERFVKEEAFKTIDKRLKELNILINSPYFGKVAYKEEGYDEEEDFYIGRFGMTPEGSYEPVVVDWRAPVSSLFYAGRLGNASYKAPRMTINVEILAKRQFIIKNRNLLGMFDSALDVKDEMLQMVLSKNSEQKLKDIIMTIQAEQDEIIRQPKDKTVVADGVAGSGKTTIALHRVAYLLYNNRETLQDKVLILGPNSIFMEYISTVLPSLGEIGVRQMTFKEFALDVLEMNDIMGFKDYMEKVLNNDGEFINEILHKTSEKYIEELDELIRKLDLEYFYIKDVKFLDRTIIPADDIKQMFTHYYKDMPLFRRSKKIKRILFTKIKDARDEEIRSINKEYKDTLAQMSQEQLNNQGTQLSYNRRLKIRAIIEEVMRVKKGLFWLQGKNAIDIYNEMNDNKELTIDDLAPILYLKVKLEGLKAQYEIKHVVIDEAQDYSALQFIVLKEITGCSAFTIVGDSNQRIIPFVGEVAMTHLENVLPTINVEHFKLEKSYRSTKEIMTYANRYLSDKQIVPIVRSGAEVVEETFNNEEEMLHKTENTLNEMREKGYESIAVVCKDSTEAGRIGRSLKERTHIRVLDREEMIYSGGVIVIPSYFAKGLEFDGVIVLNEAGANQDGKLMYVMSTRALHELYVFTLNK